MSLQFKGEIGSPIYVGANTTRTSRWYAADYIDRVLLTAPGVPPLFWPAAGDARPMPGLSTSDGWDGVEVFAGHVVLWKDDLVKWSAQNDFANWVPVGITASTARGVLSEDVVAESVGSRVGPVLLDDFSGELTVGQFVRIVSHENDPTRILYDYYQVADYASSAEENATAIAVDQSVEPGDTAKVFLQPYPLDYVEWTEEGRLRVDGEPTRLKVVGASRNVWVTYPLGVLDTTFTVPEEGGKVKVPLQDFPDLLEPGDYVSVSTDTSTGQDIYKVLEVSNPIVLERVGVGTNMQTPGVAIRSGAPGDEQGPHLVWQPFIEVENLDSEAVLVANGVEVASLDSAFLTSLNYTGGTTPGARIPAGSVFETLDRNAAGEVRNVGNRINGPIYAIVTLGEYAYILKERSIQSVQYVGPQSGTFYVRPEILDEGPVGRYAWTRLGDRSIAFVGHKGFFAYSGGQDIQVFGNQYWDDFRAEFDRSRADEIVAHHNKPDGEVWFAYPTLSGTTKVLVYNYGEGSVMLDEYGPAYDGITAIGSVEWELADTWESLSNSESYDDNDEDGDGKRWYEYVLDGEKEYTVLGIGGATGNEDLGEDATIEIPRLLLHGRVYSRYTNDDCTATAYECVVETPDFDFGDSVRFKYLDTVYFSLHFPEGAPESVPLEVYASGRDSLDDAVVYGDPVTLTIASGPSKVNVRASGRYIRLKFRSNTADAQWAISSYQLIARPGGVF